MFDEYQSVKIVHRHNNMYSHSVIEVVMEVLLLDGYEISVFMFESQFMRL